MQKAKIILGTPDYLDDVLLLCQTFYDESPYAGVGIEEGKVKDTLLQFLSGCNSNTVCILLLDDSGTAVGVLLGYTNQLPFSSDKIAADLVWYVHPSYRKTLGSVKMRKAFEFWAKNIAGARFIQMVSVNNDVSHKVQKHYKKNGYDLMEFVYLKDLSNASTY